MAVFGRPSNFIVCLPLMLVVALMPHPGALWWNVVGVLTCKLVLKPNSSLTRSNSKLDHWRSVLTSWTTMCVLVCKYLWPTQPVTIRGLRMSISVRSVPVVVLRS